MVAIARAGLAAGHRGWRVKRYLPIVLISLLLAGCTKRSGGPGEPDPLPPGPITLVSSGGYPPSLQKLVIAPSGAARLCSTGYRPDGPQGPLHFTGTLSAAALTGLRRAFARSGFEDLAPRYGPGETAPEAPMFEISYGRNKVEVVAGSEPPELTLLIRRLETVFDRDELRRLPRHSPAPCL